MKTSDTAKTSEKFQFRGRKARKQRGKKSEKTNRLDQPHTPTVPKNVAENILTLVGFHTDAIPEILRLVRPEHFECEPYRIIFERSIEHHKKYGEAPGDHLPDLVEEFLNSTKRAEVRIYTEAMRDLFGAAKGINQRFVMDQLQAFVRQQELRRSIVDSANELQAGKLYAAERILSECLSKNASPGSGEPLAKILSSTELRRLKVEPPVDALFPILQFPGITTISGPFGVGKTFVTLKIAMAVASGQDCFDWSCDTGRSVSFLDFELPVAVLKTRYRMLRRTFDRSAKFDRLDFWSASKSHPAPKPNMADPAQIAALVEQCAAYDIVFVDNVSAACRGVDMNLAESVEPMMDFATLRRDSGRSTVLVQHLGKDKSRGPRGSSKQDDYPEVGIILDKATSPKGEVAIKVTYRKTRPHAESLFDPIEIELGNQDGRFSMTHRTLGESKSEKFATEYQLRLEEGRIERGTQLELCRNLNLDKSAGSRIAQRVTRQYKKELEGKGK